MMSCIFICYLINKEMRIINVRKEAQRLIGVKKINMCIKTEFSDSMSKVIFFFY